MKEVKIERLDPIVFDPTALELMEAGMFGFQPVVRMTREELEKLYQPPSERTTP